jgi:hypothetical protein
MTERAQTAETLTPSHTMSRAAPFFLGNPAACRSIKANVIGGLTQFFVSLVVCRPGRGDDLSRRNWEDLPA